MWTALALMASTGVRHLPVLSDDRCRGVLQEADVIHHLGVGAKSPVDPAETPVACLARPAVSLPASARRSATAHSMGTDMDAVLVTDRYGLARIVTATDLIRSLTEDGPRPAALRS